MFNFDKPVHVKDWVSGCVIRTVPAYTGLLMMVGSFRFDNEHATANVRCLRDEDAAALNIPSVIGVVFEQD
jgi:hypothetical protein